MKAWIVDNKDGDGSTVVFAETRGKARAEARWTDCCEEMEFTEIKPYRFKEADEMYRGRREMDWDDPDDRRFLKEHGWSCIDFDYDECPKCPGEACERWKEHLEYLKAEEREEASR